jgi:hypothetical protein
MLGIGLIGVLLALAAGINSCGMASHRAVLKREIARCTELERLARQEARQAKARGEQQAAATLNSQADGYANERGNLQKLLKELEDETGTF